MAYTGSDITATEIADATGDNPLAWGSHSIRDARNLVGFSVKWTQSGNHAAADETDADFPVTACYDSYHHEDTRPATSQTTWWLTADAGTTLFDVFDVAMIGGHNLGTAGATAVELYVSDVANVGASGVKIQDWGAPSNNKRLVSLDLDDGANPNPQVFALVRYVGLKITHGAGIIPRIGEFWLGKRRQFWTRPRMGHNPSDTTSSTADFIARSGVTTRYKRNRDQRIFGAEFVSNTAARATLLETLYQDSQESTTPLVWVPEPNTSPTVARVFWLNSARQFGGQHIAANNRTWALDFREQAPFYDRE